MILPDMMKRNRNGLMCVILRFENTLSVSMYRAALSKHIMLIIKQRGHKSTLIKIESVKATTDYGILSPTHQNKLH